MEVGEMPTCTGTTKKGTPCKARPLKDRDVCIAHADEATRISMNFQQGPRPGRPPKPRMVDVIRERMEAEIEQWFGVLTEAREADRAVVVGNGPQAYMDMVPDHSTRLAAFREAMDRAYGKAKQATEISGPEGEPVRVELPSSAEWHAQVAQVLAETGALSVDAGPDQD